MAGSIQKRDRGRFKARYRGPDGKERSRVFTTRKEAADWLALMTVDLRRGDWSDPRLAQMTVSEWAAVWFEQKQVRLKPSTAEGYRVTLGRHILPTWGNVRLGDVRFGEVSSWVARLSRERGASTVRKAYVVFSQILASAVKDGRLSKNPASGVELPRLPKHENRYLTRRQVETLADAAGDSKPLVLTLAFCGLRFGEAAALRVRDVDLLRRQVRVSRAVTEVAGQLVWGTPKTSKPRTVPLPSKRLREMLEAEMNGKGPDDLLFTGPDGEVIRLNTWRRRCWTPAAKVAGVSTLTPHALRHTAASLAVASGAQVLSVQRMLGHSSAAMTLDVYADLLDDTGELLTDRLDDADATFTETDVASTWPGAASNVRDISR